MAFVGKFIGVDRYQDLRIRDLIGAKNDATAFWALLNDTMPAMQSELITGSNATISGITKALNESLVAAGNEDTVIVYYSGHGSHDHRITGFDTDLSNLENSTVSMQELADLFKHSKAKSILFILDCCFSGGAPAKVLEDSPIPRSPGNPFHSLAGEGRMIIAASNFDEPSYELPSTGHGVFTKAMLDVLQTSTDETVNLLGAMDEVMSIVRAEAARIGVTQTPVLLNHIIGGLSLPRLTPGARYFDAFPQRKGIRVTDDIADLVKLGIPDQLAQEWKKLFPKGLNELQLEAVNEFRILDGDSLLVIAPTSSGKTFIGELASSKVIADGKKSVFLFPYKALVNEKYDQFNILYKDQLKYRVIRCTGDYLDQNEEFIKGKYDIALLTYEMFLNLTVSIPIVLNSIGLVVLDEAQFITDNTRGISVELFHFSDHHSIKDT